MAVTVTEDLVASSNFSVNRNGTRCVRVFLVEGLAGTRSSSYLACSASGVPRFGQAHPDIPKLYVSAVNAQPLGKDFKTTQRVTVEYATPELGALNLNGAATTIEISGSNGQRVINRWPDGALEGQPILIDYSPNPGSNLVTIDPRELTAAGADPAQNGGHYYDYAAVPCLSPNTVVSFTRRESNSPLAQSLKYRGRLNKSKWQGGDPGTWLCRGVDGNAISGTGDASVRTWEVTYEFEHCPIEGGWTQVCYFRDARTGTIPPGIHVDPRPGNVRGNGYTKVRPYAMVEFNNLRLPAVV
jgi:hypothetical protein